MSRGQTPFSQHHFDKRFRSLGQKYSVLNQCMAVTSGRWFCRDHTGQERKSGYPFMELRIDGRLAVIRDEARKYCIYYGLNVVDLGNNWEGFVPVLVAEPDPTTGRYRIELTQHTDDPFVVWLTKNFLAAIDSLTFTPRALNIPILMGEYMTESCLGPRPD